MRQIDPTLQTGRRGRQEKRGRLFFFSLEVAVSVDAPRCQLHTISGRNTDLLLPTKGAPRAVEPAGEGPRAPQVRAAARAAEKTHFTCN